MTHSPPPPLTWVTTRRRYRIKKWLQTEIQLYVVWDFSFSNRTLHIAGEGTVSIRLAMYHGTEVAAKKEYEYQPRFMMTENLEIPIYVETNTKWNVWCNFHTMIIPGDQEINRRTFLSGLDARSASGSDGFSSTKNACTSRSFVFFVILENILELPV